MAETIHDLKMRIAELTYENERLRGMAALVPRDWYGAKDKFGLTRTEGRILAVLLANAGKYLERKVVLRTAWSRMNPPGEAIVSVLIGRMRVKFEEYGVKIEHRAGFGYRISPNDAKKIKGEEGL